MNLYAYVQNDPVGHFDASGQSCTPINVSMSFCIRAATYAELDGRYGSRTRFFAGASAVVQALANLEKPIANRFYSSSETRVFLATLSANLETYNKRIASAIDSGQLRGENLDRRIVHLEQNKVQAELDKLQASTPGVYAGVIAEANALFSPDGAARFFTSSSASDTAFIKVLDSVRQQLGRDIDFANQGDREAIGNAVIDHIRKTGGCDITGSRLKSC